MHLGSKDLACISVDSLGLQELILLFKTKQSFFLRIQNSTKSQAFDSVTESLSSDGAGCFVT